VSHNALMLFVATATGMMEERLRAAEADERALTAEVRSAARSAEGARRLCAASGRRLRRPALQLYLLTHRLPIPPTLRRPGGAA
jgi:hypothetical protein